MLPENLYKYKSAYNSIRFKSYHFFPQISPQGFLFRNFWLIRRHFLMVSIIDISPVDSKPSIMHMGIDNVKTSSKGLDWQLD